MLSSFVISSYTIPSFNLLLRASFRYRVRAFATSSRLRNPTRFLPLPFKPFFATTSSFSSSSSSSSNSLNACGSRTEDDSLVILGIETSCDDTAAAIVRSDGEILSQVVSSQADLLSRYGGVAPKMAEESHVQVIDQVVQQALDNANLTEVDLSAVAVTIGPGLSLCLRVGVQKARRIAGKFNLPIIGIHHMEAHALVASVNKTLERYRRSCYNLHDANITDGETQSLYQEVSKLKSKYESLQRSQRHLLGEDLGPLSAKELQRLERQLEVALSQARQRKTQLMLEQIEELRKKERQLGEMNKQLKSKLEAGQGPFTTIQGTWDAGAIVGNNTFSVHPSQSTTMDCEPTTLQIGYHNFVSAEANLPRSSESNFNQGWIL